MFCFLFHFAICHLPYSTGFASQFTIAYKHTHIHAPNRLHQAIMLLAFFILPFVWDFIHFIDCDVHFSIWTLERWIVFVCIIYAIQSVDRECTASIFKIGKHRFGVHGNRIPKIAIKCNKGPYLMLLFLFFSIMTDIISSVSCTCRFQYHIYVYSVALHLREFFPSDLSTWIELMKFHIPLLSRFSENILAAQNGKSRASEGMWLIY